MINTSSISDRLHELKTALPEHVKLVAVSKTKPVELLQEALDAGQLDLGENRVQEMNSKAEHFAGQPVRWHHIGHLQTKKVKQVIRHAHLIHAVDSKRLLAEIDKRSENAGIQSRVLLQLHIAQEEQKHGMTEEELDMTLNALVSSPMCSTKICGLMGMATYTDDAAQLTREFKSLRTLFDRYNPDHWDTCSMGMSGDWRIAVDEGSTLVRVGSAIFGSR
ncbi:MAG: YggS family pyridoxal phosphate-dependent enzyme [Crocinitomicaceae bacterium]|nr:YggS family pyridoxal phosphate-dependent enzyme [Crocinitomicaceae bacterium]